jgi:glycosyltransferase involved in cell wall biosynthesis
MSESRYKVLVNCSTLMQGGGLQVAAAFIVHALADPDAADWQYMIARSAANELTGFGIDTDDDRFHIFDKTPTRHADQRRRVLDIEEQMQPDLVFTLFGPAYVRFKARHLCGVADPWVTHGTWLAFTTLGFTREALRILMTIVVKNIWWRRCDYWWTEAECARDGLVSRLGCKRENIFIIPNTIGPQFERNPVTAHYPEGEKLRILCLSAYYSHKNLEIIPDVLLQVQEMRPELDFELTVTLPPDLPEARAIVERAGQLGVGQRLNNLGRVPVSETPALYARSHVGFLPSLLEVFSAVYPECLSTGVPLVTTDLRFARDVCKDAAAYYKPKDPRAAAMQIVRLAEDRDYWEQKSRRGKEVFSELPDATRKWELQKEVITRVAGM